MDSELDGTREEALSTVQKLTGRLCSGEPKSDGKGEVIVEFVDDGYSELDITAVGCLGRCCAEVEKEKTAAWF